MASSSNCKAVSTAEAKAGATPEVTKELQDLGKKLSDIGRDKRGDRMKLLEQLRPRLSEATKQFLKVTKLREVQHRDFMQRLLPLVPEVNYKQDRNHGIHDCSKDELFFFAAPAFFDGGAKEVYMKGLVDDELRNHYEHEPHHPEFELYNDRECTNEEITEMAVDRLARNVQYGNGIVDMEVMNKFIPKFPKGDNAEKQKVYLAMVHKYQNLVQTEFHSMFPNTKEWSK